MSAHWAKGPSRMGFTPIYAVDEHGCLLNTEPACSIPDRYGDWFMAWLLRQPCPHPSEGPFGLLEHIPALLRADGRNEALPMPEIAPVPAGPGMGE